MLTNHLPRIPIAHLPTALEALPRLTAALGGPEVWIKRDDQTGLAGGGNKTRKLEFLVAAAQAEGAETLVTGGAPQSNHCRQTAAAAARANLRAVLVLGGQPPPRATGNILLDKLLGAEIVWTNDEPRDAVMKATFEREQAAGHKPYLIPYGGSNTIGASSYVAAVEELVAQLQDQDLPPFDHIVFASSSGGTHAGLALGVRALDLPTQVLGISVDEPHDVLAERVARLATKTAAFIQLPTRARSAVPSAPLRTGPGGESVGEDAAESEILVNNEYTFSPGDIHANADYLGGGYGVMGEPEQEAIRLFAENEGILVDPVYTGRAAAGMIDLIRSGAIGKGKRVLFWHTGGAPALFAPQYASQLAAY